MATISRRCSAITAYFPPKKPVFILSLVMNGFSIDHQDMLKWDLVEDRRIS